MELVIRVLDEAGQPDAPALAQLKEALQAAVGQVDYGQPSAGQALVGDVLDYRRITALIGTLQAYVAVYRAGEIALVGPSGACSLKTGPGRTLLNAEI